MLSLICALLIAAGPGLVLGPRGSWILLVVLGVSGIAWQLFRQRRLPRLNGLVGLAVLPLLGYSAVTIAWTPVPADALQRIGELCGFFLVLAILANLLPQLDGRTLRWLGTAMTIAVALGLATLAVEVFLDQPLRRLTHGLSRQDTIADAVLNRPSVLYAAFVWPAALYHWRYGRRWMAVALLGATAIILSGSSSQSAMMGFAVGLAGFGVAWMLPRSARRLAMAAVLIAVLGILPIARTLYSAGGTEWEALGVTARHRVEIWYFTTEFVAERPIFGHGMAASRAIENRGIQSQFQEPGQSIIPLHPHNVFLQVWLELGIVGAAAALAFGLAVVRVMVRLPAPAQIFAIGQFMTTIAMLSVAYGAWQSWWVAGLLSAALATVLAARKPDAD